MWKILQNSLMFDYNCCAAILLVKWWLIINCRLRDKFPLISNFDKINSIYLIRMQCSPAQDLVDTVCLNVSTLYLYLYLLLQSCVICNEKYHLKRILYSESYSWSNMFSTFIFIIQDISATLVCPGKTTKTRPVNFINISCWHKGIMQTR